MFLALYLDEGWSRNKDGDAAKRRDRKSVV